MIPQKIALLTDSCADISPELLKENSIYVVPLRILCEDGEYLDGVNIRNTDVYARLKAGELPKTSLPSIEELAKVIKEIAAAGYDGIIAVMLSGGLSGTHNLARIIADECEGQLEMRAYDSCSASLGQGMTVLQLAEDIKAGMGWEELNERRVPQLMKGSNAFFSVDTLEYLLKGGRIGKVTALAGSLLNIKPILTFAQDGQLESIAKVRGKKALMDKLIDIVGGFIGDHQHYSLIIANGGLPEEMEVLRSRMEERFPNYENFWETEIDATLSTYIGDGVLGAGVLILD